MNAKAPSTSQRCNAAWATNKSIQRVFHWLLLCPLSELASSALGGGGHVDIHYWTAEKLNGKNMPQSLVQCLPPGERSAKQQLNKNGIPEGHKQHPPQIRPPVPPAHHQPMPHLFYYRNF